MLEPTGGGWRIFLRQTRDGSRADSLELDQAELAWRIEQALPHRITTGVEPHIGSVIARPESVLRMVAAVPSQVPEPSTMVLCVLGLARAGAFVVTNRLARVSLRAKILA